MTARARARSGAAGSRGASSSRGTARRSAGPFVLTVAVEGSGSVDVIEAGIRCDWSCEPSFKGGTSVTLVAVPERGYEFKRWSGDCVRFGPQSNVYMDAARACTVIFGRVTPEG